MKFTSLRIPLFVFLICIIALTESGSRNTASRKGKANVDGKNVSMAQEDGQKSGTKSRVSFAVQMGDEEKEAQKSPSMRKPVQTKKVNPKEAKIVKATNVPVTTKQSMAEQTQPIVKSKTVKKAKPQSEQNPKLKKSKSTGNTASSIYSNGPSAQAGNGSSTLFGKTRHQECMAGAQKVRYQDCQALRDVCPETLPMAVEVKLKEGKRCQLLAKAKNGKGYVVADENGNDVPVQLTSYVMCCKHKEFYDPFNNKYQLSEDNKKEVYKGQDKPGKLSDVTLNRLERMGKFNERVDAAKNELVAEMREAEARKAKRVKSAEALTQGHSQTNLPSRKSTRPAEGKNISTKDTMGKMAETKEEPPTQQQSSMLSRFYTNAKNAAWQTAKGVTGVLALTTGISALSGGGAPKVAVEQNGATAGGQIMAVGGGSHALASMPGGVGSAAFDSGGQLMATSAGLGRSNTKGPDGLREAVQGGNGLLKGLDKFHAQNLARMGVSPKNYYKDLEKIKEIENYGKETAADDDGFQQENNEHGNDIREFEAPTEEVDSNYGMDHEAENVAKSLNKFDHNGNVDDASEAMESPSELLDVNPVAEKMAKDDYGSTKLDANEPVENESDSGLESFKEYKEAAKSETEANHHYGQTQTFDEENHKEEMNSVTQNDLHESAQHNFPANYDMPVEKNELFEKAELEDGIKPNGYFRLIFRSAEETLSAERARMYE